MSWTPLRVYPTLAPSLKAAIGFLFRSGDGAARVGGASLCLQRYVKGEGDVEPPQDVHLGVPETQQHAWPCMLEETSVQVSRINWPSLSCAGLWRRVAEALSIKLAKELLKATRSVLFTVTFPGCCILHV